MACEDVNYFLTVWLMVVRIKDLGVPRQPVESASALSSGSNDWNIEKWRKHTTFFERVIEIGQPAKIKNDKRWPR